MKYPCENCKLRAAYEKNPKSLIGRFWRWQINFCPSWRGYFKSLPAEKQEELCKKYETIGNIESTCRFHSQWLS